MPALEITPEFMLGIFTTFAPIVRQIIVDHQADTQTTDLPTNEEMHERFLGNVDYYLEEGAAWRATHPKD